MAVIKEKTITTLVKDTPTLISMPSVPAGLTAKILGIEVWSSTNQIVDIEFYQNTTKIKHDRQEVKRQAVTLIKEEFGSFLDPTITKIEVDQLNCYATTYFIID